MQPCNALFATILSRELQPGNGAAGRSAWHTATGAAQLQAAPAHGEAGAGAPRHGKLPMRGPQDGMRQPVPLCPPHRSHMRLRKAMRPSSVHEGDLPKQAPALGRKGWAEPSYGEWCLPCLRLASPVLVSPAGPVSTDVPSQRRPASDDVIAAMAPHCRANHNSLPFPDAQTCRTCLGV